MSDSVFPLNELIPEILLYIAEYLEDQNKVRFLSINKKMYELMHNVIFTGEYRLTKIKDLTIFDRFESVVIDCRFDNQIKLPKKIRKLQYDPCKAKFSGIRSVMNYLPNSIETLIILAEDDLNNYVELIVPPNVKILEVGNRVKIMNKIPQTCTKLKYGKKLYSNIIPDGVKKLTLEVFDETTKDYIPKSIKTLVLEKWSSNYFEDSFNCNFIPEHIKDLNFGNHFNDVLKGQFPKNILSLNFGCSFNRSLDGHLPKKLRFLHLGTLFDKDLSQCIPKSVYWIQTGLYHSKKHVPAMIQKCKIHGYLKYYRKYVIDISGCSRTLYWVVFHEIEYWRERLNDIEFVVNFMKECEIIE